MKRLDLTGQKFGRLTVIEFSYFNETGYACWKCKCDCGNYKTVQSSNLRRGNTKSCGCLKQLPEGVAARNTIIYKHKRSAKVKNLEQALTDEQIVTLHKQNCHYCGVPPSNVYSASDLNGSYIYNGIDRVNNEKGYTIDNVVSCCFVCNSLKGAKSYAKFLDQIKRINAHLRL